MWVFMLAMENEDAAFVMSSLSSFLENNMGSWQDEELTEYMTDKYDLDTGMIFPSLNIQNLKKFFHRFFCLA